MVALWRDKTFQSLALTVLFLVLYMALVEALALLPAWLQAIPSLNERLTPAAVSQWQIWLQPSRALQEVIEPPEDEAGAPAAIGYGLAMLGLSVLLNAVAIFRLRVWNPKGEPIMQRERPEDELLDRARAHAAPGSVRRVWANPILWREIATRAYGRRMLLVKGAYFLVVALICYYALGAAQPGRWAAAIGLVPIAIISLLLISAQAVTSITTERDLGALDLLLVTDLTPREFIFGKLWGILYNTKEYVLPPLIVACIYAGRGLLATPPSPGRNVEALIAVLGGGVILFAFTMVLGVHIALHTENSRLAILNTLGSVFFLSVGTLISIYIILINGRFENQWLSFSGFLFAGWWGLLWVLRGNQLETSRAIGIASFVLPIAVFYSITNVVIGKPGVRESTDPLIPFLVMGLAFGFTIGAMLVPLLSEFDVALGRTTGGGE
jgi:hypothetical protein